MERLKKPEKLAFLEGKTINPWQYSQPLYIPFFSQRCVVGTDYEYLHTSHVKELHNEDMYSSFFNEFIIKCGNKNKPQ